ncbi:ABC transporter permease [Nonomuraea rubra]|uniref:Peptide/nickel transport system permease protein n=1 Tax=Nonomuraea rubra TaxID=46180 RepID=A0A7X0P0Z1_9ACTN|nr:ABC transporter permease [Nonomuraea rubra]MBB6553248.1 peptide/nickel transport system permease protein [Nonomuraea rubra]
MTVLSAFLRPGQETAEIDTAGALPRLLRRRDARIAILLLALVGAAAILAPLISMDPDVPDYTNSLAPPGSGHLLGTDEAGRDLLARTLQGARLSLGSALLVTAITAVAGLLLGVISGCVGGVLDAVVSRLIDVLLGLPGLVVTLAIVGLLGPGFLNLVIAMSATGWAALARLARATSRQAMHQGHVRAARMAGASLARVALGHVLPAAAGGVTVVATLGIGEVVVALAGLSFLGLGAQPPTAEWGTMLADARQTLAYAPWQILGPGTGLVATVLAATILSEALRDVTSPGAER